MILANSYHHPLTAATAAAQLVDNEARPKKDVTPAAGMQCRCRTREYSTRSTKKLLKSVNGN